MRTCLLALSILSATAPCASAQSVTVADVAWLRGCWQMTMGDRVIEEQWTAPAGGVMLGVGRTVRGGSLVEYEFVVLRQASGRLEYEAHPSGQSPASFLSRDIDPTRVVFENPAHDFPQRIGYERNGSDALLAWIEGTTGGQPRRREFPYKRIACADK